VRAVIATLLLIAGCGEPLADGTFLGDELLHLEGEVRVHEEPAATGPLRLAIFWTTKSLADGLGDPLSSVAQQALTTGIFPARYALSLHEPPPQEVVVSVPDGEGRYALGVLLAYVDANQDGMVSEGELEGGATDLVVLYTPGGASGSEFGTLAAGYHTMKPAGECPEEGRLPLEAAPRQEFEVVVGGGVPDVDCDGGVCGDVTAAQFDALCGEGWQCGNNSKCSLSFCCDIDALIPDIAGVEIPVIPVPTN